jgi:hypothetical protein
MTTLVLQKPYLVEQLEQIAARSNTSPETLLDTAVQEFVEKAAQQMEKVSSRPSAPPEFLREVEAFKQLKPELLKQYKGRVVAIYQGKVVMVGDNILDVHAAVTDKFGPVPCYVDHVEETPRHVRITSVWKKR